MMVKPVNDDFPSIRKILRSDNIAIIKNEQLSSYTFYYPGAVQYCICDFSKNILGFVRTNRVMMLNSTIEDNMFIIILDVLDENGIKVLEIIKLYDGRHNLIEYIVQLSTGEIITGNIRYTTSPIIVKIKTKGAQNPINIYYNSVDKEYLGGDEDSGLIVRFKDLEDQKIKLVSYMQVGNTSMATNKIYTRACPGIRQRASILASVL